MPCGFPVGFPVGSCGFPEVFRGQKDQFMTISTIIMMLAPADELPCVLTTAELDDLWAHLNVPSSPTCCFQSASPSQSLSHMDALEHHGILFELQ